LSHFSSPEAVEAYLHTHIPLSAAMGARVVGATPGTVRLAAPLAPNLNHRSTAFGGSVATLAILAGWTGVHLRLHREELDGHTVIQRSDVAYLKPVTGDFEAHTLPLDEGAWRRLRRSLARWGRGRIRVAVELTSGGETVGRMEGDYVVLSGAEET
jgi:thioesterase domain-containing protein